MAKRSAIYELISQLDGNQGPLSIEIVNQMADKLFNIVDKMSPKHLFRYRSVNENNIKSFRDDTIYLSDPETFNDPTDCMLYVNPETIMESRMQEMASSTVLTEDKKNFGLSDEQVRMLDVVNFGIDTIARTREGTKLACFSERIEAPLMWAHYADEHKGFALRYDMDAFSEDNCSSCNNDMLCYRKGRPFYPVIYKNKRPDSTGYALACTMIYENDLYSHYYPKPLLPFIVKGRDWEYEREWRCICRNEDKQSFHMEPSAIYIGWKMRKEDRLNLMSIAEKKGIQVFEMRIDYYDPHFTMYEIETNYNECLERYEN